MRKKPLFAGLIADEYDQPVEVSYVGEEPCYVVNDAGFRRHIPSEDIDRQILQLMKSQITGHEDLITEQTAKMLGQDDIFSRAMIQTQLKNIDEQFDMLFQVGIPEESLAYLGMMGLKIVINVHGEILDFSQPGIIDEGNDE